MAAPAIRIENLTVAHGRRPAVHHVSGSVAPGSMTAIVGPNGAGKTTLLRAIAGLHPPAGGLAFLGVALGATPPVVLTPVLSGSLLLVLIAAAFSRWVKGALPYPHHWL